jgi:chromosome segregation ATPase
VGWGASAREALHLSNQKSIFFINFIQGGKNKMMLLANKKIRRGATKTAAGAVIAVGAGAGILYLISKLNQKSDIVKPAQHVEYISAPPTTTSAEVEQIVEQSISNRNSAIEEARRLLLEKLELQNQQKRQISELESQITVKQNELDRKQSQRVSLQSEVDRVRNEVATAESNYITQRNNYQKTLDYVNKQKVKMAELNKELDDIYQRNEWWNPIWYLEKGNKEVEVQSFRTQLSADETRLANDQAMMNNTESAWNSKKRELDTTISKLNAYIGSNITPVENELTVLQQTLSMYQVAFDAIGSEIENLKKITGGN